MQEFFDHHQKEFLQWVKDQWDIDFKCVRREIEIQGSPERTFSRIVFQDKEGILFLLEKFPENRFQVRQTVARAVEYVNRNGLNQALAYRKTREGRFLPFFEDACFQISLFLDSTVLKRPDYLLSSQVGENFAVFLVGLSRASVNIDKKIRLNSFSIKAYIYQLFSELKIHDPSVHKNFSPFLAVLEKEFMGVHDDLPVSFCHGDLHPLNVIWNHDQITAVIDWEFAGIKPDIYDAANLVGCAGIEEPRGLAMPMVTTFLRQMQEKGMFSKTGWQFFPEYILALRFAWLSEWLRKKDHEMVEMEEAYMGILADNMEILRQEWQIEKS